MYVSVYSLLFYEHKRALQKPKRVFLLGDLGDQFPKSFFLKYL